MYGMHAVVGRGHGVCPLVRGCSLVGVSIIRGSTIFVLLAVWEGFSPGVMSTGVATSYIHKSCFLWQVAGP